MASVAAGGVGLAAFATAATIGLSALFERELVYEFDHREELLEHAQPISASDYARTTVSFDSSGTRCEAWLYMPIAAPGGPLPTQDGLHKHPAIIMGHGLGSQKDMGLHPYAQQFVRAGAAVLVFDYRNFGGSDGLPRHFVSWRRHVADWRAAVDFVHSGGLGEAVDGERVALWGTSYSGGHALYTAAHMPQRVSAVVANEPFLSARGNVARAVRERGLVKTLRVISVGIYDQLRGLLGMRPAYIKLIGAADELSLLEVGPSELEWIERPTPKRQGGWQNLMMGRMMLDAALYHPQDFLSRIRCPVLFVAGTNDRICPVERVREAVQKLGGRGTLLERPHSHLELHYKGWQPQFLAPVLTFLASHLDLPAGPAGGDEPVTPAAADVEAIVLGKY